MKIKALLFLTIEKIRIVLCPILHSGHNFVGPEGYGVAGCTRCFQFKENQITNKKILEVFEEREKLGIRFFEHLDEWENRITEREK